MQLVKLAVELGPLVVFFIANSQGGIFTGTAWFMGATVVSLTASRYLLGRIPVMPLISGAAILFFGGLTLWLQDALFIKIKPTIVNMMFASILLGGLAFGQSLLKYVLDETISLTDEGWRILTLRWGLFFIFLAGLNEVIWRNFSEEFWISFKIWGIMPITMIFAMAQVGLLQKYEKSKS
ncbi:MAG: septation protein A [Filomicrobium sp.]